MYEFPPWGDATQSRRPVRIMNNNIGIVTNDIERIYQAIIWLLVSDVLNLHCHDLDSFLSSMRECSTYWFPGIRMTMDRTIPIHAPTNQDQGSPPWQNDHTPLGTVGFGHVFLLVMVCYASFLTILAPWPLSSIMNEQILVFLRKKTNLIFFKV